MNVIINAFRSLLSAVAGYKQRWWFAAATGACFALCFPPFSHESHWLFSAMPLASLIMLIPLIVLAGIERRRTAILQCWIYGAAASASQIYWIVFDTAEGVWHLIIMGVIGMCVLFGAYYLAMGMAFRLIRRYLPRAVVVLFPAVWVAGEYAKTLGEISFPWMLIGYALTPYLALAQLAAIGGVYLLSFLVVVSNVLLWERLRAVAAGSARGLRRAEIAVCLVFVLGSLWGGMRIARSSLRPQQSANVCCLQVNLDHLQRGKRSTDEAFAVAESLVYAAAPLKPELMVLPESSLLCYLPHQADRVLRVLRWIDYSGVPLILGSLDWKRAPAGSPDKYLVYNTAFMIHPATRTLVPYYKMKLVPFSEALPFEGVFPVLSRVNLGEADFKAGREHVVFDVSARIRAVPLICYEVIYPAFVRERLDTNANLIVNGTNDGWFGRSPGPHHHALMSRMRCIENGVSMVRSANTGISMIVDQYGRPLAKSGLFTRELLCAQAPLGRLRTAYSAFGDWVVWLSLAVVLVGAVLIAYRWRRAATGDA